MFLAELAIIVGGSVLGGDCVDAKVFICLSYLFHIEPKDDMTDNESTEIEIGTN